MSRSVSGPSLVLHRRTSRRISTNLSRRHLCFAVLLLSVLAGILVAAAARAVSGNAVAFLQQQSEIVQNTTIVLIASALALLLLGAYRRVVEKANRSRPVAIQPRILSVTRQPATEFWRGQEEERKQISRELHDSVGQLLTAAGLQLRALRSNRLLPEQMRGDLEETCRLNAEALRQVRDLAMGLRPALLDDVNLVAALEWQTRQFARQTGISTTVEARGNPDTLSEAHRICIYRCVQEALTNCAKHAHAHSVRVCISVSDTEANVLIEDDGIGLGESSGATGLGVIGMRERVAGLRGTFSVAPRDHGGTALTLQIPVAGDVLA
jgi:signal transduction histidine kinase